MKRITLAIVTIALCVGVFAPVTLSLTANNSVAVAPLVASAQIIGTTSTSPDSTPTLLNDPNKTKTFNFTSQFHCPSSVAGCIEWILYFIPYKVGGWMMQAAALAFDSTAALTLSSALYSSTSFIADGWRITRDIGNIFFILILMVAALALVLDIEIGHANPKKLIASVIFIALIVNFSFFITEAIIDVSNSLALVFYNQITVQNKNGDITNKRTGDMSGIVQPKSISTALVQTFQPQQLETQDFWDNLKNTTGGQGQSTTHLTGGCITGATGGVIIGGPFGAALGCIVGGLIGTFVPFGSPDPVVPDSVIMSIELLVGIMYGVVGYSFFVATLSFIGRLVGLWLAIIFSPLAFVSYIVPAARHIEGFGWSAWWSNLFTLAFAGPIYFFFLYLISLMAQSSFVSASVGANGRSGIPMMDLMIIFLAFIFLIVMLLRATSYVKKASGEIGSMVFKGASMVGGLALAGTGALVAGTYARTVGAYAKNKLTDDNLAAAAGVVNTNTRAALLKKYEGTAKWETLDAMDNDELASSSEFMRYRRDMARDVKRWERKSKNSFDFRQTGGGNALSAATGMNMEGFGLLSTQVTAGGYEGIKARDAAKKQAFANSLGADHAELVKLENLAIERKDEEKTLRADIDLARREKEKWDKNTTQWIAADDKIVELQQKLTALSQGDKRWKIGDTYVEQNGQAKILKRDDAIVGTEKETKWTDADIGKKDKANGKAVSKMDVTSKATRTEAMSIADIERAMERAKTERAKSFYLQQQYQSPYETHGVKRDALGQISSLGHLDTKVANNEATRMWRQSVSAGLLGGNLLSAIRAKDDKAIVNSLQDGIKNIFLGDAVTNFTNSLGNIHRALPVTPKLEGNPLSQFTIARMEARSIAAASDMSHQIHEFHSTYKSPGGGFFDFLKSLGAGGGGGHGGGHGGGDHGHGGGDHGHGH